MGNFDLLKLVQPADGCFAIVGIKDKDVKQQLVETREEADALIDQYVRWQRNVFFGVAKFDDPEGGRYKDNVLALRSLWMDIDCGEGKPYPDQREGFLALKAFCDISGMPKPVVVNSGRGLHVYWPLDRDVTREEWEPLALRLRDLCFEYGLHVDRSVFEAARILRVPGTYNFKGETPALVSVMVEAGPTSYDWLVEHLKPVAVKPLKGRGITALGQLMQDNTSKSFAKIMAKGIKGCPQLIDAFVNRATASEPHWFNALSVAKFCKDGASAIHRLSEGHPDYDPAAVEAKIAHIKGPHTCDIFDRDNPGICSSCPNKGKVRSPVVLGTYIDREPGPMELEEEDPDTGETQSFVIPAMPKGFSQGESGMGIWWDGGEEDLPEVIYEHHLYLVKRMQDPVLGDVAVMRVHLPKDGVKEFVIPNAKLVDPTELRKLLAAEGVLVSSRKKFDKLTEYIISSVRAEQERLKAEHMRLQFGWADSDSKFIVGDREITASGVLHSPPSNVTANLAPLLGPVGSMEKWKEVFDLYGAPGLEPHAFATLTAFGAPLLKFFGQKGAIINLIHPNSGTGKTTILHMCNSVWGSPDRLCAVKEDTLNAKIMRLGVMNNLPFVIDEITNMSPLDFSTLAYNMSQGRGKDRVKASANELRTNLTSWQTISLCSSNASFYEKLASLKTSPDGEMMRLLEYKIEYTPNVLDPAHAKEMFDHQLLNNYGHAGQIYASYILSNMEEVRNLCVSVQSKLDKELKLTQRERFWSAVVAANISGGLIAKRLKLISWDMAAIYSWITQQVTSMRVDVEPQSRIDTTTVLGEFINRHMSNILVVNDGVDRRTKMQSMPTMEPKGELIIRYEPDTKRMFITAKSFKDDCVKLQVNYKETLKFLEESGIYKGTTVKRMSKGTKVNAPGVHALIMDFADSDLFDVDTLEEVKEDAE